jgi:hypothetical protein
MGSDSLETTPAFTLVTGGLAGDRRSVRVGFTFVSAAKHLASGGLLLRLSYSRSITIFKRRTNTSVIDSSHGLISSDDFFDSFLSSLCSTRRDGMICTELGPILNWKRPLEDNNRLYEAAFSR